MNWLANNKKWLLIIAVVLAIVWAGIKFLPLNDWFSHLRDWLTTLGFWAMPAFILIYIIATIVGLPAAILMLVGGTLFGLVRGTISVSVADTLGAGACFLLGRTVARKPIKKWIAKRPQFAELDKAVGKKGWKIVFLTRLSPLVPSNLLNYGFSLTKVNFWDYLFFTWLGMLPVIGLYVYLGSFGGGFLKGGGGTGKLAFQVIGLLFTIGVVIYTTRLAKKTVSEAADEEGKAS
ncbi:MAG: TVP38/TMEM64 family protein [Aphanothece sp. CMT-3BRIN-NPC111]|jgi:uncharacterized membrane protein YdjX (TVP38/TMEM64 family)|nr:TVP38/TMEM64 family protein [Aphanothece sp. CMT-3BRIN-NPC111]